MINSLEKCDIEIIICHQKVWNSIDERVNAVKRGWFNPKLFFKFSFSYLKLIKAFFTLPDFDIILIGYPGQFDIFIAKVLTLFRKKPIVWDVFMSIFLISKERGLDKYNSRSVKLLKFIEHKALLLSDLLIFDTEEYANWFKSTYEMTTNNYLIVPTGADEKIFKEFRKTTHHDSNCLQILYYGTFIQNHGLSYIIEGAKILAHQKDIVFLLIGDGPDLKKIVEMVRKLNLSNVNFIPWQNSENLLSYINNADIVLGAFGHTPQSIMTVQNKIYESLAMGKLIVTGDSPTIRTHFVAGRELVLCDRNNPMDFAIKILELKNDIFTRNLIAKSGNIKYRNLYSNLKLGEILVEGFKGLNK